MINTLKAVIEKVDSVQDQIGHFSRGMKTLKKSDANTRNEKPNRDRDYPEVIISRLQTAEERISKVEKSVEITQNETQVEKMGTNKQANKNRVPTICETTPVKSKAQKEKGARHRGSRLYPSILGGRGRWIT